MVRKSVVNAEHMAKPCGCQDVIDEFEAERNRFESLDDDLREHVKSMMPQNHALHYIADMNELLRHQKIDMPFLRAVNEAFLSLVKSAYWHQVEHNEINSGEFKILSGSVAEALSQNTYELYDYRALKRNIDVVLNEGVLVVEDEQGFFVGPAGRRSTTKLKKGTTMEVLQPKTGIIQRACESVGFRLAMFLVIIANSVVILIEEYEKPAKGSTEEVLLFVTECIFVGLFTMESFMNIFYQRLHYFFDTWQVFDFVLVILGWVGVGFEIADWGVTGTSSQIAQTVRVLKILRATRLLRLLKSFRGVVESIRNSSDTQEISMRIRRFIIYSAFVRAHTHAQHELIRFLGRYGKPDQIELARCTMQSLTDCYKAMRLCAEQEMHIDRWMLEERVTCIGSIEACAKMEECVSEARDGGILSSSEAEALLHTVHSYWHGFERRVEDLRQGKPTEPLYQFNEEDEEEELEVYNGDAHRKDLICMAEEATRKSRTSVGKSVSFKEDVEHSTVRQSKASPQIIGSSNEDHRGFPPQLCKVKSVTIDPKENLERE